jgi:hypothetical protein
MTLHPAAPQVESAPLPLDFDVESFASGFAFCAWRRSPPPPICNMRRTVRLARFALLLPIDERP